MHPDQEQTTKLHPTVFDTTALQITRVYAQALYDAAAKQNLVEAVLEEYESLVSDALDANPMFELFLASATIGRAAKQEAVRRIFQGKASELFLHYLLVLVDHGRGDLVRAGLKEIRLIHQRRQGLVLVEVRAAVELEEAQRQAVLDRVRDIVDGQPVLRTEVDPSVLGGLIVRVKDRVYDSSLRGKLRRMHQQLVERSSHEIQSRRDQFSHTE